MMGAIILCACGKLPICLRDTQMRNGPEIRAKAPCWGWGVLDKQSAITYRKAGFMPQRCKFICKDQLHSCGRVVGQ